MQNIEQKDIDEAKKANKIKNTSDPIDITSLNIINAFIGNQYNVDELNKILTNNESLLYKQFINKIQYAFPTIYVKKKTLPTICLYSGRDEVIGIGHYAFLKKKFEENNNNNISLIYSKYTGHNDFAKIKTINGLKAMHKLNSEILNLFKK